VAGRGRAALIAFSLLLAAAFAGFVALGAWQVQRLHWKRALIERVESRLAADPVDAPGRAQWSAVDAERDAYRRVQLRGTWLGGPDTRVQAVTGLGPGWWVMSPLRTAAGDTVLVNRGFVPAGVEVPPPPAGEAAQVTGLLRIDEPGGGFLRENDPAADRWHSRDLQAIARARALGDVAPYFVDAAHAAAPDAWPRGGLTVVKFRDSHLSYALTWFGLAGLVLVGAALLYRHERRLRHHGPDTPWKAGHAEPHRNDRPDR
jgi:surfeit locus 1 family protein